MEISAANPLLTFAYYVSNRDALFIRFDTQKSQIHFKP